MNASEPRSKQYWQMKRRYNIKKKEENLAEEPAMPDNPLMRKKKTPAEIEAEAEAEDQDEFTKKVSTATDGELIKKQKLIDTSKFEKRNTESIARLNAVVYLA
ncbi:hypothetical protein Pmani_037017 [Petrolisthes manimaculis]|uniref:Uncharacterized protein n=1 Tax=Petrolisthes manimaculis TaxID=1843537 RepID=A0AAE1NJ20_9EUCA|nr:hypothetical protein Pmani_037017 [Petrolisthes manimaculis]